ncbi:hypothetical protein V2J09_023397 [Rumex salicifolius]
MDQEYQSFCTDCKMSTEVVRDHATGDVICTECALVLESHYIDDTPEWRIFSDDTKDNDPVRVGEPTSFTTLLADTVVLSTIVSLQKGTKSASLPPTVMKRQPKTQQQSSLDAGFNNIANMVDRLGLVATINYRASELYKKAEDQKCSRGRNHDAIMAACLYVACSQENKPRTAKEICSVANGITMKDFLRAKKHVVKQLEVEMGHVDVGNTQAGDFLRRFCSYLGMNNQSVKAAQEAVEKIQNSDSIDIRRNPTSVAAAVIYILTQLSKEKPTALRDISVATGVADGTIKNAYKDLYPHVSTIIPGWFANMEDLRTLSRPRNA